MIPKKIHYCWLSRDKYPPLIEECINSWRKVLPDYEIILWDSKRFDINAIPWVSSAFESKKYAFAADYIRFYAVYTEGGIYLDSDVEVLKSFNPLLHHKSFIGFEAATGDVEPAIFGAEAGTEWCGKVLEFYKDRKFAMDANGGVDPSLFAPKVAGRTLHSIFSDFPSTAPSKQIELCNEDILVCPAEYFSPIKYDIEKSYSGDKKLSQSYLKNPKTYCIHRFNAAWGIKPSKKIQILDRTKKQLTELLGEQRAKKLFNIVRKILVKCNEKGT